MSITPYLITYYNILFLELTYITALIFLLLEECQKLWRLFKKD